jgi:hypothetical protein
MIDKSEVMHNIKVGSDTDLYLSRVNTKQKLADGTKNPKFLKVKTTDAGYEFPYLTRTTGNSLKPTTEFIQSNELRHGGAESAPRPGNTSVDGSIDVELSPVTFDDNICAVFNNEWRPWSSDADSASNLDKVPCDDGKFLTRACKQESGDISGDDVVKGYLHEGKFYEESTFETEITGEAEKVYVDLTNTAVPAKPHYIWLGSKYEPKIDEESYNSDETLRPRRLINDGSEGTEDGILVVPAGSVVNEMTFGRQSIEYDVVKKYGGVAGEDLYHIFKRLAIGTLDLNAQIGSIVTGSFGFMGDSSSDILETDEAKDYLGGNTAEKFEDGVTTGNSFIDNLPEKAIDTDQFTSREGDLWINGKNITFGQTLAFNIDKNLQKKYALFVKNPISKTSQKKAITCNLDTYLVPDSKVLYNLANNNETFEVLFAFEDKGYMNDMAREEDKPNYTYLVQIFSAKAEDKDLTASGEDDYNMSIPLRSFGERLCRIFKIALPKIIGTKAFEVFETTATGVINTVALNPNILLKQGDITLYDGTSAPNGLKVTIKVDNTEAAFSGVLGYKVKDGDEVKIVDASGAVVADANIVLDLVEDSDTYRRILVTTGVAQTAAKQSVEVAVSWNGASNSCFYEIPASE